MEITNKDERYEVNSHGELVVGIPQVTSNRKKLLEELFSRFGWEYEILSEITQAHYQIKVSNANLGKSYTFHLFHGNVRKEDPDRNRAEKKIQLGGLDPREIKGSMCLILGLYVFDNDSIDDTVVVAWPVEQEKNYPNNPSLRVNMRQEILPAKNNGIYLDQSTGKRIVAFKPDFIYYYLENYKTLHGYDIPQVEKTEVVDIFSGFEPWLTSYDNPDYTGKQKYTGYAKMLPKLVEFMYDQNLIEDDDLNDKNIDKYISWVEAYNSSDEVKEYDEKKLGNKGGIAALKKYVKYIKFLLTRYVENFDYASTKGQSVNKIFYGVPGCGKSYYIEYGLLEKDKVSREYTGKYAKENIIRTTFYQDYSNTDFVGQILPKVLKGENGEKDTVEYIFNPGPFTLALIQAISNPEKKVALVIEELNRGNAPAIFGDIFQLLDRDDDSISEYGITNVGLRDYLNSYQFVVNGEKKRYKFKEIKIPGNLDIFATMNTSDQNVYTLDTAFTRRWAKVRMPNEFKGHSIQKCLVPGMEQYTWKTFVDCINDRIQKKLDELQVNEDKQVGAFFIKESDLLPRNNALDDEKKKAKAESFAYKVLEYLWDDVSKLDHSILFNPAYTTFEKLVEGYIDTGVKIFNNDIFKDAPAVQAVAASVEEVATESN